jgi:hypothetical protein
MVSVRFPWVRRTGIREGVLQDTPPVAEGEEESAPLRTVHDRGSTSGFGDMTALAQYRFLNSIRGGTQAALLFGFKAPTGKTSAVDPFGELFEAEFQPGSGSWDGLFGFAFSQRLTPAWSLHANVLAVATGTGTQDTILATVSCTTPRSRIGYSAKPLAQCILTILSPLMRIPVIAMDQRLQNEDGRKSRIPTWRWTRSLNSMVSGTTSSAPPASLTRTRAATRFMCRRVCA